MSHKLIHLLQIDRVIDVNDINRLERDLFLRLRVKYTDTQTFIFVNMKDTWDNNFFLKRYSTLWFCCKITINHIKTALPIESSVKMRDIYKNNKEALDLAAKHYKENIDYMKTIEAFDREMPKIIELFDTSVGLFADETKFDIELLNRIKNHEILAFSKITDVWNDRF